MGSPMDAETPPVAPPPPDDELALADVIETIIRAALAPVVERLRAVETVGGDVGALRERLAVLESREPVPGPVGPKGADGLGFDDYAVEYNGERTLTHVWSRGDQRGSHSVYLPTPIYRGAYVSGKLYERGDMVTLAGSLWHANVPTTTSPGTGAPDWTLAVKRGKDRPVPRELPR